MVAIHEKFQEASFQIFFHVALHTVTKSRTLHKHLNYVRYVGDHY